MRRLRGSVLVLAGLIVAGSWAMLGARSVSGINEPPGKICPSTTDPRWACGNYTNEDGTWFYGVYTPSSPPANGVRPVWMLLHPCEADIEQFANGDTMIQPIAEADHFVALFPEENVNANYATRCWQYMVTDDQHRDKGEPLMLHSLLHQVWDHANPGMAFDRSKVFVAGFSGGAAFTPVMAATYPDDFAAFGTAAGLEYEITECDTQVSADCGQQLAHNLAFPPTAQATAPDAFHAGQGLAHRMPALVLQGDADTVVPQQNAGAIIDQWIMVNDCVAAPDCPPTQPSGIHVTGTTNLAHGGSTWSVTCYGDPTGPILEKFVVGSMSHEWPHGETTLGNTYPNAAVQMWSFFTTGSSVEGANCH